MHSTIPRRLITLQDAVNDLCVTQVMSVFRGDPTPLANPFNPLFHERVTWLPSNYFRSK